MKMKMKVMVVMTIMGVVMIMSWPIGAPFQVLLPLDSLDTPDDGDNDAANEAEGDDGKDDSDDNNDLPQHPHSRSLCSLLG